MPIHINIECPQCGDVALKKGQVTVTIHAALVALTSYYFICPDCQQTVVHAASWATAELLLVHGGAECSILGMDEALAYILEGGE